MYPRLISKTMNDKRGKVLWILMTLAATLIGINYIVAGWNAL
ncbi:Hypothetical protein Cul210932_0303 [Corynebacterium ulcerans]|nr:Hypothetical protein Cul210932_0303 [Corynebacterium ulcerans]ALD94039.1 Hypothetical protein Cul131001_0308 [Corynebacterium ulcerans]